MDAYKDDGEEDIDGSEEEEEHEHSEAAVDGAEDEDQVLIERQSAVEEFEDKEHEAQFCLESNFMDEDGQEDRDSAKEQKDKNGRKPEGNNLKVRSCHHSASCPINIALHLQTCFWSI